MSSKVGRKHYGKVPLTLNNTAAWDDQNSAASWSDDGAVRRIIEPVIKDLEAVVAQNATLGVSEYLAAGEASITISQQNEIIVGVRVENDNAHLIAYVPLRALLISALQQARQGIALDPGAQALVSNLVQLGAQLAQLGRPQQSGLSHTQGPVQ